MAKTYLEFVGGSSSKFWEGSVSGTDMTVRYGRIGSDGTTKVKSFADKAKAKAAFDKLVEQKMKKGYGKAKPSKAKAAPKKATKKKATKKKATKKKAAPKKAAKKATKKKAAPKKATKKKAAKGPKIKSNVYLEMVAGSSAKFWEGKVSGTEMTVRYGRIGSDGATQVKSFGSKEDAKKAYEKLVQQKLKKGYSETKKPKKSAAKKATKKKAAAKKPAKAAKKGAKKAKKPSKPAPTKKSAVYLEHSTKFWEAKIKGSDMTVRYGKLGANGATQVKSFDSKEDAKAAFHKLIHQKLGKGYQMIRG